MHSIGLAPFASRIALAHGRLIRDFPDSNSSWPKTVSDSNVEGDSGLGLHAHGNLLRLLAGRLNGRCVANLAMG